jgi:uncharacterized protein (TIGR03083 family)
MGLYLSTASPSGMVRWENALMDLTTYLDTIRSDGRDLADAARRAGLVAAVPSCPEWDVAGLVRHTGMVHGWVAGMVRSQASERGDFKSVAGPADGQDLVSWFEGGLDVLVDTLAASDAAAPMWTFGWGPSVAAFWFRRMAQETSIHRWDAEAAAGESRPIDADLAVDGVEEFLDGFLPRSLGRRPDADLGGSIHLHATDRPGEWLVRIAPGTVDVRRVHDKGDAAVRGTASDLLLWLWGRAGVNRLDVFGDPGVVDRWRMVAAAP